MLPEQLIVIKPYKLNQLAKFYGVNRKTFRAWLKPFEREIGKRIGHYFSIKQVQTIFDCIGHP